MEISLNQYQSVAVLSVQTYPRLLSVIDLMTDDFQKGLNVLIGPALILASYPIVRLFKLEHYLDSLTEEELKLFIEGDYSNSPEEEFTKELLHTILEDKK